MTTNPTTCYRTEQAEFMQLTKKNLNKVFAWVEESQSSYSALEYLQDKKDYREQTIYGDYILRHPDNSFTVQSQKEFERGGWSKESLREKLIEIHTPYGIYDICDHEHTDDEAGFGLVFEVDEVGITCKEGLMYWVCTICCNDDGGWQTENCASSHTHDKNLENICPTIQLVTRTGKNGRENEQIRTELTTGRTLH
jgi:hypothetical protein